MTVSHVDLLFHFIGSHWTFWTPRTCWCQWWEGKYQPEVPLSIFDGRSVTGCTVNVRRTRWARSQVGLSSREAINRIHHCLFMQHGQPGCQDLEDTPYLKIWVNWKKQKAHHMDTWNHGYRHYYLYVGPFIDPYLMAGRGKSVSQGKFSPSPSAGWDWNFMLFGWKIKKSQRKSRPEEHNKQYRCILLFCILLFTPYFIMQSKNIKELTTFFLKTWRRLAT